MKLTCSQMFTEISVRFSFGTYVTDLMTTLNNYNKTMKIILKLILLLTSNKSCLNHYGL